MLFMLQYNLCAKSIYKKSPGHGKKSVDKYNNNTIWQELS